MNKFKIYFTILLATVVLFSCQKDDPISIAPPREYSVQYAEEFNTIEDYLKSYYIFYVDEDFNISFAPLVKTGKIEASIDSDIIKGIGTVFTKELMVGDEIYKEDGLTKIGAVLEIISDIEIRLSDLSLIATETGNPIKCKENKLSIKDQKQYELKERPVKLHGVTYKVYYLVLRLGSRVEDSPTNTDAVFAAYSGSYLKSATDGAVSATNFEEVIIPTQHLSLLNTIRGWSEIFPQFKPGTYTGNGDGTISYSDFGAGVMFLPSGLAYYNSSAGSIPSYSPLVFSFKLYTISRLDTDGDGLPNFQEDFSENSNLPDRYMYSFLNKTNYPDYTGVKNVDIDIWFKDDTDQDGIPNFLDIDDDGDGYSTKIELEKETDHLDKTKFPN